MAFGWGGLGKVVRVVVHRARLDRMLSGRGGDVNQAMEKTADKAVSNTRQIASQRTNRQTGAFSDGIEADFTTPTSFNIGSTAPYAIFLELGTRPHVILGNPILRFQGTRDGRIVFTKMVNHPGIAPRNIIRDGVNRTKL